MYRDCSCQTMCNAKLGSSNPSMHVLSRKTWPELITKPERKIKTVTFDGRHSVPPVEQRNRDFMVDSFTRCLEFLLWVKATDQIKVVSKMEKTNNYIRIKLDFGKCHLNLHHTPIHPSFHTQTHTHARTHFQISHLWKKKKKKQRRKIAKYNVTC